MDCVDIQCMYNVMYTVKSQCVSLQNALEIKWGGQLLSMKCCVIEGRKFSILPKRETGQYIYIYTACMFREEYVMSISTT